MIKQILQAILQDKVIEDKCNDGWVAITHTHALKVMGNGGGQYLRVKPDPKPDFKINAKLTFESPSLVIKEMPNFGNLALVFDGESGLLKAATFIAHLK
jgi:hypothetical protein